MTIRCEWMNRMSVCSCECTITVKMEIRWYPIVQRPLFEIEIQRFTFMLLMIFGGFGIGIGIRCGIFSMVVRIHVCVMCIPVIVVEFVVCLCGSSLFYSVHVAK